MSSRLGIRQFQDPVEEVAGVVWAGSGLRVVLDRGAGDVFQQQSLHRAVVESEVGELGGPEIGLPADRLVGLDPRVAIGSLDREAVILRGDLDPARRQVLYRVIGAA